MYIAPSSGHISLNFNMPFKLILRRFEVVFWISGVRMQHFLKDWWKFIQHPPILHYGFHISISHWSNCQRSKCCTFTVTYFLKKDIAAISTTFSNYSPCCPSPLGSYTGSSLVQNVLPHPGILRVRPQHLVAYVDGIHVSLGLHVVERQLVACETWKDVKSQFIIKK